MTTDRDNARRHVQERMSMEDYSPPVVSEPDRPDAPVPEPDESDAQTATE